VKPFKESVATVILSSAVNIDVSNKNILLANFFHVFVTSSDSILVAYIGEPECVAYVPAALIIVAQEASLDHCCMSPSVVVVSG
jgi:hypothetical protein